MTTAAEDTLARLAEEHAALRRVATLVASSPKPEKVFEAVAQQAGRLLGARSAATVRFDDEKQHGVIVGRWDAGETSSFEVGTLIPYTDPDSLTFKVAREGGRIDDYADVPGESARMMRAAGYRSSVAAPIVAGGRTWGCLFVVTESAKPFGTDAEHRLRDFAEL